LVGDAKRFGVHGILIKSAIQVRCPSGILGFELFDKQAYNFMGERLEAAKRGGMHLTVRRHDASSHANESSFKGETLDLGGAVASQVRIGNPMFDTLFPIIFGALAWTGLLLRENRLRALIPLRSQQ
jgi:hypothetical protein